jgi:hypothetical protein
MVFMKLRISIIVLGASLLLNSGCSTMKMAYVGKEESHLTNPDKVTAMNNGQPLMPVAEPPLDPPNHSAYPGGTGSGAMTGMSNPGAWGGRLSTLY